MLATFRLDKYDVTVGRFRQFVAAWNNGVGWLPSAGSGKHAHLNGGIGLANSGNPGTYETGWLASDDGNVAPTNGNLACDPNYATWTASAGSNETRPIICENWYEAYASPHLGWRISAERSGVGIRRSRWRPAARVPVGFARIPGTATSTRSMTATIRSPRWKGARTRRTSRPWARQRWARGAGSARSGRQRR